MPELTSTTPDVFTLSQQLWKRWLDTLSVAVDSGLRSTPFLYCMRYGLKTMVEAQKLQSRYWARHGGGAEAACRVPPLTALWRVLPMATAFPLPEPIPHISPIDVQIPSFSLLGKKALVTGGSRGIGRACALMLAAAGADVAVGSSPTGIDFAESVCLEIRSLGRRAEAYNFDVGVADDVEATSIKVNEDFEHIDILVNNAGVTRDRVFRKMDRGTWDR